MPNHLVNSVKKRTKFGKRGLGVEKRPMGKLLFDADFLPESPGRYQRVIVIGWGLACLNPLRRSEVGNMHMGHRFLDAWGVVWFG